MNHIKVFVLLAISNWIAHFWQYASFGLYEDDFYRITRVMEATWTQVWEIILEGGGQGRPLHDGLIYLFSFLGIKLGGLHFVYWIGYLIITLNSFLFYILLKYLSNQQVFVVTGAIAFCLFPADTTQAFLTHSLGIQPSLMFLLLALYFYVSGKKKLSYLTIVGTLLCYETMYPVFLSAPLLKNIKQKWNSKVAEELLRHCLILGVLIVCAVIVRKLTLNSIGVISNPSILFAIITSIRNMIIGPIFSMSMFLYRPFYTLLALDGNMAVVLLLCFAGFVWVLFRLKLNTSGNPLRLTISDESKIFTLEVPQFFKNHIQLALSGLVMLVLAYPLTLTTYAVSINGRSSRVHASAIIGASILCAYICSAILFIAITYCKKRLASLSLAGFFTLLIEFGLIVQQDYKLSWQYQREFWTNVVRLCPHINDGTIILIESTSFHNPKQIDAYGWSIPLILDSIYQFPEHWKIIPIIYMLQPQWQKEMVSERNSFQLSKTVFWLPWLNSKRFKSNETVESSNVILLEVKNEELMRITGPLVINGHEFRLKENSVSELLLFNKGPLYNYLIKNVE
ncbi:hypothetical protein [aff. Roholtiella sp. LEGE 12411]|uniref:hypothetical protein n=1 Tax=aff. Roholtiella sp. LEGE 12411 TaxID=1828822 RepID=UPI00187ED423|nr:hypothetical protein [aff. Roholtiella sp. LEGE 12411]MBE9034057.1 hypothetical protein [aff. Roholtiella sp. LEGE 12411]